MPYEAPSVAASTKRTWNAGRPPCCRYSCRMSGVLANRFGRMYSRTPVCVSSVKYSVNSSRVLRQVKYEYDCEKPLFARYFMIFGRVKASDRKMVSGCRAWIEASAHCQNRNDLVCGLSTRKIFTPWPIQNSMMLFSSSQSAGQSLDSKLIG